MRVGALNRSIYQNPYNYNFETFCEENDDSYDPVAWDCDWRWWDPSQLH